MKAVRKTLTVVSVLLLLVGGVAGYFLLTMDGRIQRLIEQSASEYLGVPVTVRSFSVSLLDERAVLRGFSAPNPAGFATPQAFGVGELSATFERRSIFRDVVNIPEIQARGLDLTIEGGVKGSNIAAIVRNAKKAAEEDERNREAAGAPPGRAPRYRVGRMTVKDTTIHLSATFMGGREASYTIPRIDLTDLPAEMTAGEILGRLIEAVLRESAKAPGKLGQLLGELTVQAGIGLVGKTLEGAGQVGQGALEGVGRVAKEVGTGVGEATKGVGAGIGQGVVGVAGGVGEVGGGAARGAGGAAEGLGRGVGESIHRVGAGIGAVGGGIIKGAAEIVKGVGSGAVGAVEIVGEICKPEPGEPPKKGPDEGSKP